MAYWTDPPPEDYLGRLLKLVPTEGLLPLPLLLEVVSPLTSPDGGPRWAVYAVTLALLLFVVVVRYRGASYLLVDRQSRSAMPSHATQWSDVIVPAMGFIIWAHVFGADFGLELLLQSTNNAQGDIADPSALKAFVATIAAMAWTTLAPVLFSRVAVFSSSENEDAFIARLLKLAPMEAVAAYPFLLDYAIKLAPPDGPRLPVYFVSCTLLMIVVVLRWRATQEPGKKPQWGAVLIAAVSFVLWVQVMGGAFGLEAIEKLGPPSSTRPPLGSSAFALMLLAWGTLAPAFYRSAEVRERLGRKPEPRPEAPARSQETYSAGVRRFHWWTMALIAIQLPLGLYMVWYGERYNFAPPTGTMYDAHKIIGMLVLLLVASWIAYRILNGRPGDELTIAPWQRALSRFVHWAIYGLLICVPLLGWLATSAYGPFRPFGFLLPGLLSENQVLAERLFGWHMFLAKLLLALVGLHAGAALFHYVVRRDDVLARMLPVLPRRHEFGASRWLTDRMPAIPERLKAHPVDIRRTVSRIARLTARISAVAVPTVAVATYLLALVALNDLPPPPGTPSATQLAGSMGASAGGPALVGHDMRLASSDGMHGAVLTSVADGTVRLAHSASAARLEAAALPHVRSALYERLWRPWGAPIAARALWLTQQLLPLEIPASHRGRRGRVFRDCEECPEMIEIEPGVMLIGTPLAEWQRYLDLFTSRQSFAARWSAERPRVMSTSLRPFAAGRFEVTFAQWDACVADGGCNGQRPADQGWGRGQRPVINVNWRDAIAYTEWLSRRTGKTYRLLTEWEWEYVARAGSTTPWHWGSREAEACNFANARVARGDREACPPEAPTMRSTKPVGSLQANALGLHDTAGNAWEWVQDCWSDSHREAGMPALRDCELRVIRGGSWADTVVSLRSATRGGSNAANSSEFVGFRVARNFDAPPLAPPF